MEKDYMSGRQLRIYNACPETDLLIEEHVFNVS